MNRTRAFFLEEAAECLRAARAELERAPPDRTAVYRAIRRLRGSAQLARFTSIARRAGWLEHRLREREGAVEWPRDLGMAAGEALGWLEVALERVRAGEVEPENQGDARMDGEARVAGVVELDELEYRGQAALERALQLRPLIEEAAGSGAALSPVMDELFDLIRLGMK